MTPTPFADLPRTWHRLRRQACHYLTDVLAFGTALAAAALAAVLLGSLGGCGGGVGSEGTGAPLSVDNGPITGFGSIVVNGVRYDDSAASLSDDDGGTVPRSALALGMVVQVQGGAVTPTADGTGLVASARQVTLQRALVGPVTALNLAAGSLQVLGQQVRVTGDTTFAPALANGLASLGGLPALEVYGLYDPATAAWVATHVAPAAASATYRVSGPVASVDGGQAFTLGQQRYTGSTAGLVAGAQVTLKLQSAPDASGRWVVNDRRADSRLTDDDRDNAGLEGVVATVLSASRFTVAGVTVDSSAASVEGAVQPGARVEVRGSLKAGVLLATRIKADAADAVRGFELKGTPSQLDTAARRFVLRGVTVAYAGARFKDGDESRLVGYAGQLEVKGLLSSDRQVLQATEVEFDD